MKLLDCTLRDGGYYTNWDFEYSLIHDYLEAMQAMQVDFVEIGFRSLKNDSFKGGFAYSSDKFLNSLKIPSGLSEKIAVMINGSEISNPDTQNINLKKLFNPKKKSPVTLVRIACHAEEFIDCLPASNWLNKKGYLVGFNLMQVSSLTSVDIKKLCKAASQYPIDVLYFADSLGSLNATQVKNIVKAFKKGWQGSLGIHAHDNTGEAINNSVIALKNGASWIDSTVTGMGRGPGNAQTELIILALAKYKKKFPNNIKLLETIRKHFKPMQNIYNWGKNHFYYLGGLYEIHPSYIQVMLQDKSYDEENILGVIDFLKVNGGKKFSIGTLNSARNFYSDKAGGEWNPMTQLKDKDVLIIGSGPGIKKYRDAIQNFIVLKKPYVIALNTQSNIRQNLIDARIACHPLRLLADCKKYLELPQPLITPYSNLPNNVKKTLVYKDVLDFGMTVSLKHFKFSQKYCEIPSVLVFAYSLAVANSGRAKKIFLAGFDGHNIDDPRQKEMDKIIRIYKENPDALILTSITPTSHKISINSVFGLI